MLNLEQDEAWLAQARARVAAGADWERTPEEIEAAAKAIREARRNAPPGAMCCPYCDIHPPLQVYPRFEVQTMTPLRFCPNCYGFWAAGDALATRIADPYDDHPALRAVPAPRRCRACSGRLDAKGACMKCRRELPTLNCPACGKPMERFEQQGIMLDQCDPCDGVWFDTGEISAVYDVSRRVGLVADWAKHSEETEPPEGMMVARDVAVAAVRAQFDPIGAILNLIASLVLRGEQRLR